MDNKSQIKCYFLIKWQCTFLPDQAEQGEQLSLDFKESVAAELKQNEIKLLLK